MTSWDTRPSTAPRAERASRRLTITYYVDPRSMRTIVIPLGRANVVLGATVATVLWATTSFMYAGYRVGERLAADGKPVATVALPAVASLNDSITPQEPAPVEAVQEAEAKHDDVATDDAAAALAAVAAKAAAKKAEAAATSLAKTLPAKMIRPVAAIKEPAKQEIAPEIDNAAAAAPAVVPVVAVAAVPAAAAKTANPSTARLTIKPPRFSSADGELTAKFPIINIARGKTAGKVWGIATFVAADGSSFPVASAEGIDILQPESAVSIDAAMSFSALRHTYKSLRFKAPDGAEGRFAQLKIYVKADDEDAVLMAEQEVAD
jgi:hypothetical protein